MVQCSYRRPEAAQGPLERSPQRRSTTVSIDGLAYRFRSNAPPSECLISLATVGMGTPCWIRRSPKVAAQTSMATAWSAFKTCCRSSRTGAVPAATSMETESQTYWTCLLRSVRWATVLSADTLLASCPTIILEVVGQIDKWGHPNRNHHRGCTWTSNLLPTVLPKLVERFSFHGLLDGERALASISLPPAEEILHCYIRTRRRAERAIAPMQFELVAITLRVLNIHRIRIPKHCGQTPVSSRYAK